MAIQIFGELLYYPEPGVFDALPSPDALKHQIVLSTKPPKEYLDSIKPAKESLEIKDEAEIDQGVLILYSFSFTLNFIDLSFSVFLVDCKNIRTTAIRMEMRL